jgi:hypothetical protein
MSRALDITIRALAVWVVLITAESIHGMLRFFFLSPRVGEHRSSQIGVLVGSVLILLIAYWFIRWIGAVTVGSLLAVGFFWLALTLAFEFGAGHFLFHRSWESLTADYRISEGGLMPFGMVILILSPLIAARLRGIREPQL